MSFGFINKFVEGVMLFENIIFLNVLDKVG